MVAEYEEMVLLFISRIETDLTSTESDLILNAYNCYLAVILQKHETKKG